MGVSLKQEHIGKFALHADELLAWNQFANLTAIRDPQEIAESHFLDALPLLPWVPIGARVLDIGSGGGFPGIPLKVLRPDLHICLIDSSRKKVSFLKHVVRTLGLKDTEARQIRAEELSRDVRAGKEPYQVVVSRAASKLDKLLDQAFPLIDTPGRIIAMKGVSLDKELESVGNRVEKWGVTVNKEFYCLPGRGINRMLIIFERT